MASDGFVTLLLRRNVAFAEAVADVTSAIRAKTGWKRRKAKLAIWRGSRGKNAPQAAPMLDPAN